MSDNDKRIANYEESFNIYRSKTALIMGVLYMSKGYQSIPTLAIQFAACENPDAEQKTFNWDTEDKIWYFPSYDKMYQFYRKLGKWKNVIAKLRQEKVTDQNQISEKVKDYADREKISNPMKKKTLYMSAGFYQGYLIRMTLSMGKDNNVTVSINEEELDMIMGYVGDLIKNYHSLALQHRTMNILMKGGSHNYGGGESGGRPSTSTNRPSNSSNTNTGGGNRRPTGGGIPDDDFGGEQKPAPNNKPKGGSGDSVDDLLNGSSLDDIMSGINNDDDSPF